MSACPVCGNPGIHTCMTGGTAYDIEPRTRPLEERVLELEAALEGERAAHRALVARVGILEESQKESPVQARLGDPEE